MSDQKDGSPFDAYYYDHGCGRPYQRDEAWLAFFGGIGKRIADEIRPQSVLDAGCAMGFLVESLRGLGVDAFGIDISHYAIENVHPSIRDYCREGSIAEPFDRDYDLIVCIEVLEHMPPEEAETALRNLCSHTNDILFSSTPFDYKEATHVNVRPPEYWAERFALNGFVRDVDFDASYITPWATRFVRRNDPLHRIVRDYERRFFQLWKENSDQRELVNVMRQGQSEQDQALKDLQADQNRAEAEVGALRSELERMAQELISTAAENEARIGDIERQLDEQVDRSDDLQAQLDKARTQLEGERQHVGALEDQVAHRKSQVAQISESLGLYMGEAQRLSSEWEQLHQTRAWRVINWIWRVRTRLLPSNSVQGRAYDRLLRAVGVARVPPNINSADVQQGVGVHGNRATEVAQRQAKATELPASRRIRIDPILPVGDPPAGHPNLDIVVCVHNALDDVRQCLESLVRNSTSPYHLTVVDDGSDKDTQDLLRRLCDSHGWRLIRNEDARGYTRAANQGLRETDADMVILLNSDTEVPAQWLDRMCACMQDDERIGLVGPLSNTASWQSVPQVLEGDDWAANPIPDGLSFDEMAKLVADQSAGAYPRVTLLNGFCLMIRRALLEEIGFFDEDTFGDGYGEEDDFVLRARAKGWQIAVADDVYIYHAQSKSYSSDRRHQLTERAGKALAEKHGQDLVTESCATILAHPVLEGIRARIARAPERQHLIQRGYEAFAGKRVIFALPVALPGGGANVIFSEARAMQAMGVDVRVFNLQSNRESFLAHYSDTGIPVTFGNETQFVSLARLYDAAVATVYFSVEWLEQCENGDETPIFGYYVQGFEPLIYAPGTVDYARALASYSLIPGIKAFTKTDWTRRQVLDHSGLECENIGASVDIDLFRPRSSPKLSGQPLTISAMIRPSTVYREPIQTMNVLRQVKQQYGQAVDILIFGATDQEIETEKLPTDFPWRSAGVLRPDQVAHFFDQTDIFLDLSSHQAMGLSAMEAMACGNAVIVPKNGGVGAYGRHEENCLIVDTTSFDICLQAARRTH